MLLLNDYIKVASGRCGLVTKLDGPYVWFMSDDKVFVDHQDFITLLHTRES